MSNRFCFTLHFNRADSYLLVNFIEIYKFKANNSETNAAPLCLGNVSKHFSADSMNKTRLYGHVYHFQLIMIVLMLMIF